MCKNSENRKTLYVIRSGMRCDYITISNKFVKAK